MLCTVTDLNQARVSAHRQQAHTSPGLTSDCWQNNYKAMHWTAAAAAAASVQLVKKKEKVADKKLLLLS